MTGMKSHYLCFFCCEDVAGNCMKKSRFNDRMVQIDFPVFCALFCDEAVEGSDSFQTERAEIRNHSCYRDMEGIDDLFRIEGCE